MQFILVVLLSIAAAVIYGILHDQITARICIEYFTIGHPPIFHTDDPTLLAIGWGIVATWWVGAMIGLPLALSARVGNLPKRSARSLIGPIATLLLAMAVVAAAAGVVAWLLYRRQAGALFDPIASGIPISRQAPFLIDLWIHLASYGSGFLGGLILIAWVLVSRFRARASPGIPLNP